jgi:hypothetical protein
LPLLAILVSIQVLVQELLSPLDVVTLRSLVTTFQQENDDSAVDPEVDPVSGAEGKPKLHDARADGFMVAEVALLEYINISYDNLKSIGQWAFP